MTEKAYTPISVADVKRRFADVLGAVRFQGRRYVVERNGTPMAALVPLTDLPEDAASNRHGFLALIGAFEDAPEYADALEDAVKSRQRQRSRRVRPLAS